MHDNIIKGVKICSKWLWHQSGFEKRNALHGTIKTLLDDGKEITTRSEICVMLSTL